MLTLFGWTSEQGSRQLVYSAIGERDNEDHMKGAFVNNTDVVEPSDFVLSEEGQKMQDNVWVSRCVVLCGINLHTLLQRETIETLTKTAPQLDEIVQGYLV